MELPRESRALLYCVLWRLWKWFIHVLTGRCELHRLAIWSAPVLQKTRSIQTSLMQSRTKSLREVVSLVDLDVSDALERIHSAKKIPVPDQQQFTDCMRPCVVRIRSVGSLLGEVESLREQKYSQENTDHEKLLHELWSLLNPHTPLEGNVSKQWQDIGFQGKDPTTDFRGMGMLGPACLHYFSTCYEDRARSVLSHSHHPQHGYPYAIVGINLTSLAYTWLKTGVLHNYLYTACEEWPLDKEQFMEIVCYLLVSFDTYWMDSRPENVMVFPKIREQFAAHLRDKLDQELVTVSLKL